MARRPLSSLFRGPVAPSPVPFDSGCTAPHELNREEIPTIVQALAHAARRAFEAGFEVVELHGAHGYLIHEFLSPLANQRMDEYGGSFQNRTRFALEVIDAVRQVWPDRLPLFLRISATDWVEGGWNLEESVALARIVREHGVDLVDCSSGAIVSHVAIPAAPGYQVPFAERIRGEAEIRTGAVGLITEPQQADSIIRNGSADVVLLAREFLRRPYWPIEAAEELKCDIHVPVQYARAFPGKATK